MWLQEARNILQSYQRRTPAFSSVHFSAESPSRPHQVHLLLNPALQLPPRIGIQLASAWQEETEAGWLPLSGGASGGRWGLCQYPGKIKIKISQGQGQNSFLCLWFCLALREAVI